MVEQSFRSKRSEQVLEKGKSFPQLRRSSLPDSHSCVWMRERSSVQPRCVTNATGLCLTCYRVFPILRKQCPEPEVGTFPPELTTQMRSCQWQALMDRLTWNQRASWCPSHLSSETSAFLLLYNLLGKTKHPRRPIKRNICFFVNKFLRVQKRCCYCKDGENGAAEGKHWAGSCLVTWLKILQWFQDCGPPRWEDLSRVLILYN